MGRGVSPSGNALDHFGVSVYQIEPRCPYFGDCTGCQWQHIDYECQLRLKFERVVNALTSVGLESGAVLRAIPSPQVWGYRNHARFTVRRGTLGFVNWRTRRFVPVDFCYLMDDRINSLLKMIQGRCTGTSHLTIRCGVRTNEFLIQPSLKLPEVPSGQASYHEVLCGRRFRISAASFFQVNTLAAEKIIETVGKRIQGSKVLVDAYAGVGTFSVVFSDFVEKIIAIEESPAAFEDAMVNLEGRRNVEFWKDKTEEAIFRLNLRPDCVILNPPRVGCRKEVFQAILRLLPARVVYVSCNPAAMAGDIRHLVSRYRILEIQPIDLFPHTYHVECVATLELV